MRVETGDTPGIGRGPGPESRGARERIGEVTARAQTIVDDLLEAATLAEIGPGGLVQEEQGVEAGRDLPEDPGAGAR